MKVLNPGSKKTTVTPWFLTQAQYKKEFNIEGNPLEEGSQSYVGFMEIIRKYKPTQTTLVPDSTSQITSDHGWEMTEANNLDLTKEVRQNSSRCSIFVDADTDLDLLTNKDINAIEIYTGPYAQAVLELSLIHI